MSRSACFLDRFDQVSVRVSATSVPVNTFCGKGCLLENAAMKTLLAACAHNSISHVIVPL